MIKNNYLFVSILLCSIAAQLSLQLEVDWLQYSRVDIEAGQWWRFITGNLIHLNWRHFAMNAIGFAVIYLLFPNILRPASLLFVIVLCCLAVTLGLWLFSPLIYWYVGLSGALHGILVVLLVLDYVVSKNVLNIILMALLIAKLGWEFTMGPLPGSEIAVSGPVVVEAHYYGALGGVLLALCFLVVKFNKNK